MNVRGLFYGIGHQPNSHLFADAIELDDKGYVKVPSSSDSNQHAHVVACIHS